MNIIKNKEDCCGCTACINICPQNAINMIEDKEGFLYPHINKNLCIRCGLCKKVCIFTNKRKNKNNIITYAVKHNDINERIESQSGGMFAVLAKFFISNNNIVYGVGYKEKFQVYHKRAINTDQINEFRGSKYVQSNLGRIFLNVKNDLIDGKKVLFSGTPCQIAGLNSYLKGVNKKNLYLVDIICHGVPSPKVWRDFLNYYSNKYNGNIEKVNFRNKRKYGWQSHIETITINHKEYDSTIYSSLFYEHNILRPSCFNCNYKNINRVGDITIGDFWGIDNIMPKFNDNKGVSLVIINTNKGKELFENIKKDIIYKKCNIYNNLQPPLKENWKYPKNREKFWKDYNKKGFKYILKKYGENNFWHKFKAEIKCLLKNLKLYGLIKV